MELIVGDAPLQVERRGDKALELCGHRLGAVDPDRAGGTLKCAVGEEKRQPGYVVEVAVGQEEVIEAAEPQRSATYVESDSRRIDTEPGLVAGSRRTLERQVSEPEAVRFRSPCRASGAADRAAP